MKPRFAAKAAPRRRRKVGVLAELGQTAAILRAQGTTRMRPVALRARVQAGESKRAVETEHAEQTKRAGRFRGKETFARRRREEEIPD